MHVGTIDFNSVWRLVHIIINIYSDAHPQKNHLPNLSIIYFVGSADFFYEFRFVDVESEIDAERALQIWRALNHLLSGSTDIRAHTLQVSCENKRRGKSSEKREL